MRVNNFVNIITCSESVIVCDIVNCDYNNKKRFVFFFFLILKCACLQQETREVLRKDKSGKEK